MIRLNQSFRSTKNTKIYFLISLKEKLPFILKMWDETLAKFKPVLDNLKSFIVK